MRSWIAAFSLLISAPCLAATHQCWSPPANGYKVCADGVTVQARANAGPFGDWSNGISKRWENVAATEAVYVCTIDLPLGAGDGCPTPADASARYMTKADVLAAMGQAPVPTPEPPVPEPPTQPANGTAVLTWTAPTQNTDGSQLTNLAGYYVYHGLSAAALTDKIAVAGTSYTYTDLAVGTHYFAVTAYNSADVESAMSPVGSKTITAPTCPAKPADETRPQSCQAGTTGSWTQTRTYSSVAAPACWAAGDWLPSSAPAGACAPIPPPDPCVADPLVITNLAWPGAASGRRSIGYNSGTKAIAKVEYTAPGTLKFTDSRGCVASASR